MFGPTTELEAVPNVITDGVVVNPGAAPTLDPSYYTAKGKCAPTTFALVPV